jgi:2-methylisocitrate lyase-like PEP mutase family enzyme
MDGPSNFRLLLKNPGIIRSLGAHDIFTARLIEDAGLETLAA